MKAALGRLFLPALLILGACLFTALGVWQVERRGWKLDLIERVQARVRAEPVSLPPRSAWATLEPRGIEYLRVAASGRFLHERETLVDALTERGAGFWVITPLRTGQETVLVNRGFVPPERRAPATRREGQLAGEVAVVGLVRLSEPDGRILRPNRAAQDRWYSRDVARIAAARGLADPAPFFIDAGSTPNPGGYPMGGLTVVRFHNRHMVYAVTWFALALMCLAGFVTVLNHGRKDHMALGAR